jgi:hypothetical protein
MVVIVSSAAARRASLSGSAVSQGYGLWASENNFEVLTGAVSAAQPTLPFPPDGPTSAAAPLLRPRSGAQGRADL